MYAASDNDLKESLMLADERYEAGKLLKLERKNAARKARATELENVHARGDRALRLANKADKEAGREKRAREAVCARERLANEEMADADEDSRVRMALLSEKLGRMDTTRRVHMRRFDNPSFHLVPRRKMMQIQSGRVGTICQVLDKNNRTNTWQKKDACVVEQCLSALALCIHRQAEKCQELLNAQGGVQAIVTSLQECAGDQITQEVGFKLVADACLTLESCAEVFARAGVFEAIVETLSRLLQDSHLQVCGFETMGSICAALPDSYNCCKPMDEAFRAGVHHAAARALKRHPRSESVLVAGMRTLEILASRSDPVGKSMIQESFATTTGARDEPTYPHSPSSPRSYEMTDNGAGDDHQGSESLIRRAQGKDVDQEAKRDEKMLAESKGVQQGLHHQNGNHDNDSRCFERDPTFPAAGDNASPDKVASDGRLVHRGTSGGAASFALQVADAWSRDDSRTIVRRAGAALTAASALSLLWAVLMDAELGGDKNQKGDDVVTPSLSVSSAVDEFVEGQGVEVILAAMEHHLHDPTFLLAAWQAMHSVIRLVVRATTGVDSNGTGRLVSEALLVNGKNLELTVMSAVRSIDAHSAVAPLQWICLVCLSSLHSLDARVSDFFIVRNGCQLVQRCLRTNARHTAVIEQGCRLVAGMSEPSFTLRTRFFVEKIQDAIHEVMFLHGKHRGVQVLASRALDALWGADEFGAKQKEAAAARLMEGWDEQKSRG